MEAIGGISAVTAVLEFGFSLVTAIHAYVGDYRDAPQDIISLAKDIEAVTVEVKAISDLVEHDQAAKDLDQGNSRVAEKCVGELKVFLAKLSELLGEAGISTNTPKDRVPTNEDISKRMKLYWPLIKAKVEEVQRKLDRTRIQILLARSCLEYRVSPTAARREEAQSRIPGLFKLLERQRLADDLLHARTAELKLLKNPGSDALMQQQRMSNLVFDGVKPKRRDTKIVGDQADGRSNASQISENTRKAKEYFLKGQEVILQQLRDAEANSKQAAAELEKIRAEIRDELREAKAREEAELAEQNKLRQDAVEKFKMEQEKRREQEEATRKHLESIFDASSKEQIDQCMQALLQGQVAGLDMGRLALAPSANKDLSKEDVDGSPPVGILQEPTQKRVRFPPLSFWRRKRSPLSGSSARAEHKGAYSHASDTSESSGKSRGTPIPYGSDGSSKADVNINETLDAIMRFAHLSLSYHTDNMDNDECVPFDGTEFQHDPCGNICDFQTTMRAWARIPQGSKTLALERARTFFGPHQWELHTILPIEPGLPAYKGFFRDMLSRNRPPPFNRGIHVVLVIFSAQRRVTVETRWNSNTKILETFSLSKLFGLREWLKENEVHGELGAIDAEIERRTQTKAPAGAEGPHITVHAPYASSDQARGSVSGKLPLPHAFPPPTPPLSHYSNNMREIDPHESASRIATRPHASPSPPPPVPPNFDTRRRQYELHYTQSPPRSPVVHHREVEIRSRPHNELSRRQYMQDLAPRRITGEPLDRVRGFSNDSGPRTYKTVHGGTAVYDRAGLRLRSPPTTPPPLDLDHPLRVLEIGAERRLQPTHPLPEENHRVLSFGESVASDTEALNTALIKYTGGGVAEKDVSNVPDDEERHPLTPEVASASHEDTRLHASPEPIVGLKRNLTATAESDEESNKSSQRRGSERSQTSPLDAHSPDAVDLGHTSVHGSGPGDDNNDTAHEEDVGPHE